LYEPSYKKAEGQLDDGGSEIGKVLKADTHKKIGSKGESEHGRDDRLAREKRDHRDRHADEPGARDGIRGGAPESFIEDAVAEFGMEKSAAHTFARKFFSVEPAMDGERKLHGSALG
jgi:hypothetical protein